jgi:inorganic pyrophosphatase
MKNNNFKNQKRFIFIMMTVLHPWHGVHYGEQAPRVVTGVIEISQGSGLNMKLIKPPGF